MSRGNSIIVSAEPGGKPVEGLITSGQTFYPGMVVQMDPTVALQSNKHTYKIYDRDADGNRPAGPYVIVLEDSAQGKSMSQAYDTTAGTRFKGYIPAPGDELNLYIADIAGTGDDHTKGELLIVDDGTGKFIATTGSPESEPAMLLETLTDPTADQLAWCIWTGY